MIGKLSTCDCIIDTDKEIVLSSCEKHKDLEYETITSEHKQTQDSKVKMLKLKRIVKRYF